MILARAAGLALALAACAWFALGVRQARDLSAARAIVSGPGSLTSARAGKAESLLRAAGTLNPDSQVQLLRGEVALREQERARARRILEAVVSGEPMNIQGWILLAQAAYGSPLVRVAVANIARLAPRG